MKPVELMRWQESRGFKVGAAVGAVVLATAGTAWAVGGMIGLPDVPPWTFGLPAVPASWIAVTAVRRVAALARSLKPRRTEAEQRESAARGRRSGIRFGIIFAVEGAAMASASTALALAAMPLLIPVAVLAVFAIHLLPIGRLFAMPIYVAAGLALTALSAACLLIPDPRLRISVMALSAAVILWGSAFRVMASYARLPAYGGPVEHLP